MVSIQTLLSRGLRVIARNVDGQRVEGDLAHIALPSILTRLERLDDQVASGVEVPGGVFVLRAVTTPHVPTNRADAPTRPRSSGSPHNHSRSAEPPGFR